MGILIAIEGVDGSGKQTQSDLLNKNLKQAGYDVMEIRFPDYESRSSVLVKMYLMGEFSQDPKDITAYQASTFFAADRYASWMTGAWRAHYQKGGIVLADRYTTANMVHQAGKIQDLTERDRFLEWLYDFEFRLYGIPVPDLVFFLMFLLNFSSRSSSPARTKSPAAKCRTSMKPAGNTSWNPMMPPIMWQRNITGKKSTAFTRAP